MLSCHTTLANALTLRKCDVNPLGSAIPCVKGVKSSLITFALSCFVSDALPRSFPPYEACLLHTTPLLPRRPLFPAEQAASLCVLVFVRPVEPQPPGSCALSSRRQSPSWPPPSPFLLKYAKWDSWLARGFHSNWPSASIISLMRTARRI